ncbi:hypothetical protein BH23BAC4_BH23BAC4_17830 [soil metagenome]
MKAPALVKALEEAVRQLGVRVRYERGTFRGGLCTIEGEQFVMLNRRLPAESHVVALASALAQLPHESLYLRPNVRAALEDAWASRAADRSDAEEVGAD